MMVRIVCGRRSRAIAVAAAVLAGSQLGHAITYLARFGLAAGTRQSEGAHAYLPTLAGAMSAGVGVLMMSALLVIAAARTLSPMQAGHRRRATLRFSDLLPALFVAQLLVFAAQETIESIAAGGGDMPSAIELLLWGTLGQLPAATIAAAVVAWLLSRLEEAWTTFLVSVGQALQEPPAPAVEPTARLEPAPALQLSATFPSAFRKRGPPLCSNS